MGCRFGYVACFIVNFAKSGTPRPRGMPDQARQLLRVGLWGVPPTAQLRARVKPGDGVVVVVGAPDRVFVGDAVVAVGYHRFGEDDAARFPEHLRFEHGITLRQARVWPGAVPVMSVWPRTSAARTNPNALWFGSIRAIGSVDAAMMVAAGTSARQQQDVPDTRSADAAPGSAIASLDTGRTQRHSIRQRSPRRDQSHRRGPVASAETTPKTTGQRVLEPRVSIDLAARVLSAAETSPAWLPTRIAHADWGTAPGKRVVATAELHDGAYLAQAPAPVAHTGGLLERMGLNGRGQTTLLGFDFPIGVPRAYAHSVGIKNFADWFRELDLDSQFFAVAADVEEVSTARPFFPTLIAVKTPGIKERFHQALGLTDGNVLRHCDRAHCRRRAASEMFWALGPQAVGKATLVGWKDTLRPALAETTTTYALWPFDGRLADLLAATDAVVVETYPAEAYRQLGLQMGMPGPAKTRQADRRADAQRLLEWCADHAAIPHQDLTAQLIDGFGPTAAGEDAFDAVAGLFGMIDTVRRQPEPDLPEDPEISELEGWMFGQHDVCP